MIRAKPNLTVASASTPMNVHNSRILHRVEYPGKYGDSGILVPLVGVILCIQILAQR